MRLAVKPNELRLRLLNEERKRQRKFHPALEPLEERTLLTVPWTLDPQFSSDGYQTIVGPLQARAAIQDNQGRTILAGYAGSGSDLNFAVVRLEADGDVDTTFDSDGIGIYDPGMAFRNGPTEQTRSQFNRKSIPRGVRVSVVRPHRRIDTWWRDETRRKAWDR